MKDNRLLENVCAWATENHMTGSHDSCDHAHQILTPFKPAILNISNSLVSNGAG